MIASIDSLIALVFLLLLFAIIGLVYLWQNQRKQLHLLQEALKEEQKEINSQKDQLNKLISIAEESQRRIAMELHDNLGASLNLTKTNIEHLKSSLREHLTSDLSNLLQHTTSTLNEVVYRVRNISRDLQPDVLERQGLVGAINDFIQGVMLRRNIEIDFIFNTDISHLTTNTELAIYRVLQESVNNTIKYAKAQHLSINLALNGDKFKLILKDDGVGFDTSQLSKNKGIGIINMQIRAKQIDAKLEVNSTHNQGTTIILHNHD